MASTQGSVYRMSVEEFSFAVGVGGDTLVAGGMLRAFLGDRSREAADERLVAAGHSLLAREYASVDIKTGSYSLVPGLHELVQVVAKGRFSIRCECTKGDSEGVRSYFFSSGQIAEHDLTLGVVSELRAIGTPGEAQERARSLYGLAAPQGRVKEAGAIAAFPADALSELSEEAAARPAEETVERLRGKGVPEKAAKDLASDLKNQELRGSVMRIETEGDKLVSNRGFVLLKGPERLWMLELKPEAPTKLDLRLASAADFDAMFQRILA